MRKTLKKYGGRRPRRRTLVKKPRKQRKRRTRRRGGMDGVKGTVKRRRSRRGAGGVLSTAEAAEAEKAKEGTPGAPPQRGSDDDGDGRIITEQPRRAAPPPSQLSAPPDKVAPLTMRNLKAHQKGVSLPETPGMIKNYKTPQGAEAQIFGKGSLIWRARRPLTDELFDINKKLEGHELGGAPLSPDELRELKIQKYIKESFLDDLDWDMKLYLSDEMRELRRMVKEEGGKTIQEKIQEERMKKEEERTIFKDFLKKEEERMKKEKEGLGV